eukprot:scaffold17291_cov127-Isochrysis_galbana.AAC.5
MPPPPVLYSCSLTSCHARPSPLARTPSKTHQPSAGYPVMCTLPSLTADSTNRGLYTSGMYSLLPPGGTASTAISPAPKQPASACQSWSFKSGEQRASASTKPSCLPGRTDPAGRAVPGKRRGHHGLDGLPDHGWLEQALPLGRLRRQCVGRLGRFVRLRWELAAEGGEHQRFRRPGLAPAHPGAPQRYRVEATVVPEEVGLAARCAARDGGLETGKHVDRGAVLSGSGRRAGEEWGGGGMARCHGEGPRPAQSGHSAYLEHRAQAERARRERQVFRAPELLEGCRVHEPGRNGILLLCSRVACPGHLGHQASSRDPDGPLLAH